MKLKHTPSIIESELWKAFDKQVNGYSNHLAAITWV